MTMDPMTSNTWRQKTHGTHSRDVSPSWIAKGYATTVVCACPLPEPGEVKSGTVLTL